MNSTQLQALARKNKGPLLAGGAGLVALLALRNKRGGRRTVPAASSAPANLPGDPQGFAAPGSAAAAYPASYGYGSDAPGLTQGSTAPITVNVALTPPSSAARPAPQKTTPARPSRPKALPPPRHSPAPVPARQAPPPGRGGHLPPAATPHRIKPRPPAAHRPTPAATTRPRRRLGRKPLTA